MKKTVLFLMVSLFALPSKEQAQITYDPTNAVKLTSVLGTLQDLKGLGEEWKSTGEFLKKLKDNSEEVKRFIRLMESIVCMTDETDLLLRASNGTMLCERRLEFDLTIGKIEGINTRFKTLLNGVVNMTQAETVNSLKSLNDELEKAIMGSVGLNEYLRRQFLDQMEREHNAKHGHRNTTMQLNMNL